MRKSAKANTVTTIFTTKAHAEIELSAPENAQMGAEAQAYSAFSPVNSIIYIWNHNFLSLCRKIVLYFATSKGNDKIVSLPLYLQMDVLTCCTLDIFTVCFLPQTMEIYWLLELIVIAQSNE